MKRIQTLPNQVSESDRSVNQKSEVSQTVTVKKLLPAFKAVSKLNLSVGARCVWMALAGFSNVKGIAWPSQSTLAKAASVRPQSVNRYVSELEAVGAVQVCGRKYLIPDVIEVEIVARQVQWNSPDESEPDQKMLLAPEAKANGFRSHQKVNRINPKEVGEGGRGTPHPQAENSALPEYDRVQKRPESEKAQIKPPEGSVARPNGSGNTNTAKDGSDASDRLLKTFKAISVKQRVILLDQVRRSAKQVKDRSFYDGQWDSSGEQRKFKLLKQAIREMEGELFGFSM